MEKKLRILNFLKALDELAKAHNMVLWSYDTLTIQTKEDHDEDICLDQELIGEAINGRDLQERSIQCKINYLERDIKIGEKIIEARDIFELEPLKPPEYIRDLKNKYKKLDIKNSALSKKNSKLEDEISRMRWDLNPEIMNN